MDDHTTRPGRTRYAVAGLAAGLVGLAVSHLVAVVVSARATPVVAVAESVIELTPGATAETLIQLVGQWDKPLLITGVLLAVVALSAVAGLLARRSLAWGVGVFLALATVGLLAVATGPAWDAVDVVPVLAGVATWAVALPLLVRSCRTATGDPAGRRRFLATAGAVGVGAAVVALGGTLIDRSRRGVAAVREALDLPVSEGRVPEGATFDVAEIAPWRTPNPEFYRIDTALVVPEIDPAQWRLRIHGLVEDELELSYDDLLSYELTEAWVTIACVSNEVGGELIGNAWWSGVPVRTLLAAAGVRPEADAVLQTSVDEWNCGTPIEALTDDREAMVAVAMNGEPLPAEHGFPARVIVPGLYGYVSATKWVVDLEVTQFSRFDAYWTERGWSERGPIKLQSRIDTPRVGATVDAGSLRVGGYAWAQTVGVSEVEYSLDGGPWRPARLARVPGVDTWVQWVAEVDVEPGEHLLVVRATDAQGTTQTSVRRDVVPDGATGWHVVRSPRSLADA